LPVQNSRGSSCVPVAGAYVVIWHCEATGIYSGEPTCNPGGGTGTVAAPGRRFLRGCQIVGDTAPNNPNLREGADLFGLDAFGFLLRAHE
jgi:hypothetical protein